MTVNAAKLEAEILQLVKNNPGRDHEPLEYVVLAKNGQTIVSVQEAAGALDSLVNQGLLEKRHWGTIPNLVVVYGLPEPAKEDAVAA